MVERELNRQWILFHLKEGLEELTRTIADVETDKNYTEIEFQIAMAHLYNHLNTAWNSRCEDDAEVSTISEHNFYKWRAFPLDIPMD
jgi:hypothetical protein